MSESRRLAVVMFTDIADYSAIMQQNKSVALVKITRFREILNKKAVAFNGEIIQYYGDGALIIFTNSADAVNCSIALQEAYNEEPTVPTRIGIHLGDIIVNEGNIFGDSVNITSRIQSMGVPGAVLISESVQNQIKNKPQFKTVSLGNFMFKNIVDPLCIYALALPGFRVPNRNELNGKFKETQDTKSIAVLPFVNMSNDAEQEYFSDGIAEEIINSLTHLKDLNVAGRTSSFQFKGKNIDLREVGKKLSVGTVLEGSVRRQGNRFRIMVQLINVADGYHLWSERYDREINDLFAIQDEIALSITKKLRLILLKKDRELITKVRTQNPVAYELYLKGRFHLERRGASLLTSIHFFQQAIETDPAFALAHSGCADANLLLATYGLLPPNQVMPKAKQFAEKALQLDATLSQPYCSLGFYYTCFEWNWPEAKRNCLAALDLNPKFAEGHYRYGLNYLASIEGDFEEAKKHGAIAIQLEPLSAICYANYALILSGDHKFPEALSICKTGIELDANSFICHVTAGKIQLALKQYANAILSFEAAMKLTNRHPFAVNGLIWTYCQIMHFENAKELMDELEKRSASEYIAKTFTGISAAFLGDLDKAMMYLEEAYNDRDPIISMLKYEIGVPANLKEDARFKQLVQRIAFPEKLV